MVSKAPIAAPPASCSLVLPVSDSGSPCFLNSSFISSLTSPEPNKALVAKPAKAPPTNPGAPKADPSLAPAIDAAKTDPDIGNVSPKIFLK